MSVTLSSERGMRLRRTNSTSKAEDIVTEDAKVRILSYNHLLDCCLDCLSGPEISTRQTNTQPSRFPDIRNISVSKLRRDGQLGVPVAGNGGTEVSLGEYQQVWSES